MEHRRLIVVTSMSSREKAYPDEDSENKLQLHNVVSWTIDEYLQAVQYDALYRLVEPFLDVGRSAVLMDLEEVKECDRKEERVRRKYYFAGGSCRLDNSSCKGNFGRSLRECARHAIRSIFRGNVGESSPQAINRLLATFYHNGEQTWMSVSKYVASKLASKAETSTLKRMISVFGIENPSVKGMLFFQQLKRGELPGMEIQGPSQTTWDPQTTEGLASTPPSLRVENVRLYTRYGDGKNPPVGITGWTNGTRVLYHCGPPLYWTKRKKTLSNQFMRRNKFGFTTEDLRASCELCLSASPEGVSSRRC
eukprot:760774-Hanusia_phi.AAC.2